MKKLLFFLLVLMLLFTVVACNGEEAPAADNTPTDNAETNTVCTHTWANATCTTPKTCVACGVTEGDALGHSAGESIKENEIAATCGEAGSYESVVYCSLCKTYEFSRATVSVDPTEEHIPAVAVRENEHSATCTTDGSYDSVVYCSVCENELSRENLPIPSLGTEHSPEEQAVRANEKAATCSADGSYDMVVYCKNCSDILSSETFPIPSTGTEHSPAAAIRENEIPATCGDAGGYDSVVYCSVCKIYEFSRTHTTVDATGNHSHGAWIDTQAASFTQPGEKTKTCSGCGDTIVKRTYLLNDNTAGIKILGERHATGTEYIATDWSCSGIEFYANITETSGLIFTARASANCYFKVYVDGVPYQNGTSDYFVVTTNDTLIEIDNLTPGKHTIRIIKVTGYTLARAQIYSVTLEGSIDPVAPAEKELYIEFLGDSISCGWGVVGTHDGTYSSQDGSLAYPYRLAERLNADYSITALSGKGVIYGTPNFDQNYLDASPLRPENEKYYFERSANIVVINLGTNEAGNGANRQDFEDGYVRLLQNVFDKNGDDCVVYCLWGAMNDAFSAQIKNAINRYLQENPNARIYTYSLPQSTVAGGAPSWGHPSIGDNQKYMLLLESYIKSTYYAS